METVTVDDLGRIVSTLKGMGCKPRQAAILLRDFQSLSAKELQELLDSGILRDIARIKDLARINRKDLIQADRARFPLLGEILCGHFTCFQDLRLYVRRYWGVETDRLTRSELRVLRRKMPIISGPKCFVVTVISLADLFGGEYGDNDTPNDEQIFKQARTQGLALCPPEAAFYFYLSELHMKCGAHPHIQVAHEPVRQSVSAGLRFSLDVPSRRINVEKIYSASSHGWRHSAEWMFVVPD